jgi:hypothetical protein
MVELIKKIEDRIKHLQNEKVHMKQFVRTAKLAEAQKIHDWAIECSKLRQDAVSGAVCDYPWHDSEINTVGGCIKCGEDRSK